MHFTPYLYNEYLQGQTTHFEKDSGLDLLIDSEMYFTACSSCINLFAAGPVGRIGFFSFHTIFLIYLGVDPIELNWACI